MSLVALCVVLNTAGYVRVTGAEDLTATDVSAIVRALDAALERRISVEHAARQEVTIELLGGLTVIRLIAEHRDEIGGAHRAETDLPLDRDLWIDPLEALVRRLFPNVPAPPPLITPPTATVAVERERSVVPWIVLGAIAVATGVGITFGLSSKNARRQSEAMMPGPEFDRLADRTTTHAIVADVLWISALIGGGTAAVLYLTE